MQIFLTSGLFVSLLLVFVLLLMWADGNTVDAVSVHTRLVVATELALTGNHLGARQSIQEGLREHKLELLILH